MRSFLGVCFGALLLVARSGSAIRYTHRSGVMSAEVVGDVSKTLLEANEVVNAEMEATQVNKDMQSQLSNVKETIVGEVCEKVAGNSTCGESVIAYVNRCDEGDCLTLDSMKYKPLSLPNPYQLDAAFMLFRESDSNPAKNEVKRFWMRSRSSHGDYHHFVVSLLKKNVVRDPESNDVENFASQYFYMTTLYYKTYLTVDFTAAKFFNKLAFTTRLFGFGIQKALKRLVRSNLPVDLGTHPEATIREIASGYGEYMMTQVPAMTSFAERFSKMATKTLLVTVGDYVHLPAYKRWYRKFKEFIVNFFTDPAKLIMKHVSQPVKTAYTKLVPEEHRQAIRNVVGQSTKHIANGVRDLSRMIKEPSQQIIREKLPHYLSKAKGAVEHVVKKVKSVVPIKQKGDQPSEAAVEETVPSGDSAETEFEVPEEQYVDAVTTQEVNSEKVDADDAGNAETQQLPDAENEVRADDPKNEDSSSSSDDSDA
nr:merozoite surface protein p58 [Babesia bigemina]